MNAVPFDNRDVVYVLSNSFPYHRLLCTDAGPGYAADLGWETCRLSELPQVQDRIRIIDPHITEQECDEVDALIARQSTELFFIIVGDPYVEENQDRRYFRMLFGHKGTPNVYYLSRYQPAELTEELNAQSGRRKMLILPYPFDAAKMLDEPQQRRKRKVIFSGNPTERIYPDRYRFLRGVRRRPFLWPFVDILPHPGYPDTGSSGTEPAHPIVGDRYVEHLSQYRFMFVDPSRCDLEFLKYRECAYAGCLPVGRAAPSLPQEAQACVFDLDPSSLGGRMLKLLVMGVREAQERANTYRRVLAQERHPALLNEQFKDFTKRI